MHEFKYLGSILCKYGSMEGETRERAVQGRKVVGSLGRMMKERTISMEVKQGLFQDEMSGANECLILCYDQVCYECIS